MDHKSAEISWQITLGQDLGSGLLRCARRLQLSTVRVILNEGLYRATEKGTDLFFLVDKNGSVAAECSLRTEEHSPTSVKLILESFDLNPKNVRSSYDSQQDFIELPAINSAGLQQDKSGLFGKGVLSYLLPFLLNAIMTDSTENTIIPSSSAVALQLDTLQKLIASATIQRAVVNLAGQFHYFNSSVNLRDGSNVNLADVQLDLAHKQLESTLSATLLIEEGTIRPTNSGLLQLRDLAFSIPQFKLKAGNRTVHVQSLAPFDIAFDSNGSAELIVNDTTRINLSQGKLQFEQLEAIESPKATSLVFTLNAQLQHALTLTLGDGIQLIASQFHSRISVGSESRIQTLQARLTMDKAHLLALLRPEIEKKLTGVRLYAGRVPDNLPNKAWEYVDIQPGVVAQLQWVNGTMDTVDVNINAKLGGEHKTFIASKGLFDWPMKWESDGHQIMGDASASLRCTLKINPGNNASIGVNTTVNSLKLPSFQIFFVPVGDVLSLISKFGHFFTVPDASVPLPNIGAATDLSFMQGLSIKSAQVVPSKTGNTVDLDINVSSEQA